MWYCHRKMTKVKDLKKQFPDFVDKIDDSGDETFMISIQIVATVTQVRVRL